MWSDLLKRMIKDENEINAQQFVILCENVANVYDTLFNSGLLSQQLKKDMLNSAQTIRIFLIKHPLLITLKDMVEYELYYQGRDKVRHDKTTGIIGLLWAKRALEFIVVFMGLLFAEPKSSASHCARHAYAQVLSRYHSWMTSTMVYTAMSLAPNREDIVPKLESIEIEPLRSLVGRIQSLLDFYGIDFPDKV
jgi:hypothetical protein